jgi:hypothetical protein
MRSSRRNTEWLKRLTVNAKSVQQSQSQNYRLEEGGGAGSAPCGPDHLTNIRSDVKPSLVTLKFRFNYKILF